MLLLFLVKNFFQNLFFLIKKLIKKIHPYSFCCNLNILSVCCCLLSFEFRSFFPKLDGILLLSSGESYHSYTCMCNRLAIELVLVPLHGALGIQNRFTSIFRIKSKLSLLISKDFVNGLNLYGIIFSGFLLFLIFMMVFKMVFIAITY